MRDPRIDKLAEMLVTYSMGVQKGDHVAMNLLNPVPAFAEAAIEQVYKAGALPFVQITNSEVSRAVNRGMDEAMAKLQSEFLCQRMDQMDCALYCYVDHNAYESSDVPSQTQAMMSRLISKPLDDVMRKHKNRWALLQWPTEEAAQKAEMSTEAFEDFFFDVCCVDYKAMGEALKPLVQRMEQTDKVHLKGPGTDLAFSIKGIPAVPCDGHFNIPDGEIYTAPVKDSLNGVITFNTPSVEDGFKFENIVLTFENGKCVDAKANNTKRINEILDTDAGARFVGEFALGVNPKIKKPMCDTLFDEKIAGSVHFALGACYDEAPNGNASAIHWDLVLIQTPEYGGGELWFDDVLIRKDGDFVLPELFALNPEK